MLTIYAQKLTCIINFIFKWRPTGVFYFLNSTINPILYSVMSKRFRRAFRDKLCRPSSCCCLCFCCSEVVIIDPRAPGMGPLGVSQSAGGVPGRLRAQENSHQSTTTRNRVIATYGRNNVNNGAGGQLSTRTIPPGELIFLGYLLAPNTYLFIM